MEECLGTEVTAIISIKDAEDDSTRVIGGTRHPFCASIYKNKQAKYIIWKGVLYNVDTSTIKSWFHIRTRNND